MGGQAWPGASGLAVEPEELARVESLIEAVRALRSLRADLGLAPSERPSAALGTGQAELMGFAAGQRELVARLAGLGELELLEPQAVRLEQALYATAGGFDVYLKVADPEQVQQQVARLDKEIAKSQALSQRLAAKLENPGFLAKAPAEVVAKDRAALAEAVEALERLRERRARLGVAPS